MKKLLFVFNPHSGKGQIRQHLMQIVDIFTKGGYEVTIHPTQAKNDAYEKIMSRSDDFDVVVCSGGDGTLNETIKAVMSLDKRIPIGYIPSGTMNDFASSIGIPKDMVAAAQKIVDGNITTVDIGCFNQDYFTYIAAFGMFTEVSYETPQQMKNMFGSMAYIMEGMKRFNMTRTYPVTVTCNGETFEDNYIFGMVSNSSSIAGIKGFVGNDIGLDDGLFEVFLIKSPKTLTEFQFTMNALLKHELDAKCFAYFKASEVIFHSENDLPWTLDGEFGGNCRNVSVVNKHMAIDIFAGEKQAVGN